MQAIVQDSWSLLGPANSTAIRMVIAAASPLMRFEIAGGVCVVQEVCQLMPSEAWVQTIRVAIVFALVVIAWF